jgi:hypothetical protein
VNVGQKTQVAKVQSPDTAPTQQMDNDGHGSRQGTKQETWIGKGEGHDANGS